MAAKKKPDICGMCGELLKEGIISQEGMKFCSKTCADKKKKKPVCEFC
jgi:hypothetical protein